MNPTRLLCLLPLLASACSYAYRNPAEALAPGEVAGRTVAGVELLVDGVAVSLKGGALDTHSRVNGRFGMLPLPVGHHTLLFKKGRDRGLLRDVEIAYGKDGQPAGVWLGDVTVPATGGVEGRLTATGRSLGENGTVVDETTGEVTPSDFGDFSLLGLAVGVHRLRFFSSDAIGLPMVGGPLDVTILPTDGGTVKSLGGVILRPATGDPASVKLRFRIAGDAAGLTPAGVTVTGLPATIPVVFDSTGLAQVAVPEGYWTLGLTLPAGFADVAPPPTVGFVAVAGQTVDLGTLYAATFHAQDQATYACHSDADCGGKAGTTGGSGPPDSPTCVSGACLGYSPPQDAGAGVPFCTLATLGCSPGPFGGVWNPLKGGYDPPFLAECRSDRNASTAAVSCGACCTIDGIDKICAVPGQGACPLP